MGTNSIKERLLNGAPFSYRNNSLLFHFIFVTVVRQVDIKGVYISTATPDWQGTAQKNINIFIRPPAQRNTRAKCPPRGFGLKIQLFWYPQFEASDVCSFCREVFQTTELIVVYHCYEGSFGLQRSCSKVWRPEFWLSKGLSKPSKPTEKATDI